MGRASASLVRPLCRPALPSRQQGGRKPQPQHRRLRRTGAAAPVCKASSQHARVQTLNRYGIETFDFGTRYLQQGCVGDDVAQLQAYMRSEGLQRGEDAYPGYFGDLTEAAVSKWQKKHDLPQTGGFGDLARETYLQKQELKLQRVIPAATQQEGTPPFSLGDAVWGTFEAQGAGKLAAGMLLAAAALVAGAQCIAWLRRAFGRANGDPYRDAWGGEYGAMPGGWEDVDDEEAAELEAAMAAAEEQYYAPPPSMAAAEAQALYGEAPSYAPPAAPRPQAARPPTPARAAPVGGSSPPISTPHGNYFSPSELRQLRAKSGDGSAPHDADEDGGDAGASSSGGGGVALRQPAEQPKPAAAQGSYFGGSVRRPSYSASASSVAAAAPAQRRSPWDASGGGPPPGTGAAAGEARGRQSGWGGALASVFGGNGAAAEQQQCQEEDEGGAVSFSAEGSEPPLEWQEGGGGGDDLLPARVPSPPRADAPWQPAPVSQQPAPVFGAGFANPKRALYSSEDLRDLGRRLTARSRQHPPGGGDAGGEAAAATAAGPAGGEVWVSNVRIDPSTGQRINAPRPVSPQRQAEPLQQQRRGGDYIIVRGNEKVTLGGGGEERQAEQGAGQA